MLVHDSLSFPMDYLLKPVTEEELRECLQNVREELDEEREQNVTEEIFRICGADISSGFARKVMTYFSEHVDLNLNTMRKIRREKNQAILRKMYFFQNASVM